MAYTAIDCQGFAGGFTLGVAQAGFKLIGKREMKGGFGVRNCEANRHLLGDTWTAESCDPTQWSVPAGGADIVFGNPPCSGFSVLTQHKHRGEDSKVNHCMWAFVEYAARVRPQIAVFESVQLAYTQGRSLMRQLRTRLEQLTGESWTLYHVLHNALSVGGPSMRKRYFWVAVRSHIPFGVEVPKLDRVPLLGDVIGDLQQLDQRWDDQPYRLGPTWYSARLADKYGLVDGHISLNTPHMSRVIELVKSSNWQPGEYVQNVTRRYFHEHGELPAGWHHLTDKLKNLDFFQGIYAPIMWHPDRHTRVLTGGSMLTAIHWAEPRFLTHREAARILGFPDSWLIAPLRGTSHLRATWGKGITVDCGRWIANWARHALDGAPGELTGTEIGERERLIDVTNTWKTSCGTVKPKIDVKWKENIVTEVATTEAPTEAPTDGRKGRPRPVETVERDQRVFDALASGGLSREALTERTGLTSNLVYLSLWRLKRDSRVEPIRHEGAQLWQRVAGAA